MANDKDFKVKNGVKPTRYVEGLGTITAGSESDFNNVTDASKSFTATQGGGFYSQAYIKPDGTKMYIMDGSDEAIHQYSLSTAFDVSTASFDTGKTKDITGYGSNHYGLFFNPNGTQVFVTDFTTVRRFTLTTAWDIATLTFSGNQSKSIGGSQNRTMYIKSDGTYAYWTDTANDVVYQSQMTTPFDVSTLQSVTSLDVSAQTPNPFGVTFSPDGLTMLVSGPQNDNIYRYVLSTAFDVTSATYSNIVLNLTGIDSTPASLHSGDSGTKLYIMGNVTDTVYQYSTVKNTDTLDLSTGSVFNYTPTASKTLKVSSPAASGTNSSATLLVNGNDAAGVSDKFSTTIYTGNGSTQTITNGIDLSGEGGLVWFKSRESSGGHTWYDTLRGVGKAIYSNNTNAQGSTGSGVGLTAFNSNGFSVGTSWVGENTNNDDVVSWTWKKTANFFDIVTYTGNGSNRTIAHNLGCEVGMMLVKLTSGADGWAVYHRGLDSSAPEDYRLRLDGNNTRIDNTDGSRWNRTAPTSSVFSLGTDGSVNANGSTYVAYLFAHNSSTVSCGSYTGDGSDTNREINVGFKPQWLMVKNTTTAYNWIIIDSVRGEGQTPPTSNVLFANATNAEDPAGDRLFFSDNGFTLSTSSFDYNKSGDTFVYVAIAEASAASTTYDSNIKFSGGTAPASPAIGETDVITLDTTDGGTNYYASLGIDGAK